MYLAGMAAGSVSKSGKLGIIGAFQIPQLLRSINAFTLGAQSVNPKATTTVVWTGGWWEPQKEAEATNAFADQGIDRSEEHTSELQSLMRISYAVFCLKKKIKQKQQSQ